MSVKKKRTEKKATGDLLARAYLDILAAEHGSSSRPMLRRDQEGDPIDELLDELAGGEDAEERTTLRADHAAVAVLTARAIEAVDGLTRELRRASPVVALATGTAETVDLVASVLKECAFGADARVMEASSFATQYSRPVLLVARDGTAFEHKPEKQNDVIAKALHARAPIVGIAPEPRRHLPRDLQRASEYNISIGQLDNSALSLVLEAVTGGKPTKPIDDRLVKACEVSDLPLGIRSDRSADQCVARLTEIIDRKRLFLHDGPLLEELSGYGEAKVWGMELAADLADYRAGRLDWSEIEKGLLLAGPPGTGKTSFAQALAKQANIPLVATSVADWNSASYLSGTLAQMKAVFAQAKRLAPAILFIDELDGISDRNTVANEHREYWLQIVNLLLELLAGIEDRAGVVVIGATNNAEKIDPAVRRAGRLDRTITIELPSVEDLAPIFRFHLGRDLPGDDMTPAALAAQGATGADVEAWVRRARSRARRAGRPLSMDDLLEEARSGRSALPPRLRRMVAIHEAGHLVVGLALEVFEASAVAIMDQGGITRAKLDSDHHQTLRGLENVIAMLLAGRAAEELILPDEATAGAGNGENSDFARATAIAADIETKLGFGVFGPVQLSERSSEIMLQDPRVFEAVRARMVKCLAIAQETVAINEAPILAIAGSLNKTGYLGKQAINALLQQYPLLRPLRHCIPAREDQDA